MWALVLFILFFAFVHEFYVSVFDSLEQIPRLLASYTSAFVLTVLIINFPKNFKRAFQNTNQLPRIEPTGTHYSKTLSEKDGLPKGCIVTYRYSPVKPTISQDAGLIIVTFGEFGFVSILKSNPMGHIINKVNHDTLEVEVKYSGKN